MAAGIVRRHNRTAVLCAGGQQSVAAGVVHARRPSRGTRSVFSLRFIEHRQLPGTALLPGAAGADVIASHAKLAVDVWVWIVDRADRRLRRSIAARTAPSDAREHRRRCRPSYKLGVAWALGIPRGGAIRLAYRGHRAHFDRRRRSAVALGASAFGISPDLGIGVSGPPPIAPSMDVAAATACHCRRHHAACRRQRAKPVRFAGGPSVLLLRHRDGLSWRTGANPTAGAAPHGLLCRAVVRRHGGWVVCRSDRSVFVFVDSGISDPRRIGGIVQTRRPSAGAALGPLVLGCIGSGCHDVDRALISERGSGPVSGPFSCSHHQRGGYRGNDCRAHSASRPLEVRGNDCPGSAADQNSSRRPRACGDGSQFLRCPQDRGHH